MGVREGWCWIGAVILRCEGLLGKLSPPRGAPEPRRMHVLQDRADSAVALRGSQELAPQGDGEIDRLLQHLIQHLMHVDDDSEYAALALPLPNAVPPSRGTVCPRLARTFSLEKRGSRERRMRAAPAVSCAKCTKENAHEHTGSAEAPRHSLRNGFTAYTALSPATNSSCHRRCRLDGTSDPVGSKSPPTAWHQQRVSGPHGFAVRSNPSPPREASPGFGAVHPARCCPLTRELALRTHTRRRCRVHRIPAHVRDDARPPLLPGKDGASW
jgi:hypothetical protein